MPRRGPVLPLTGKPTGGAIFLGASIDISPSLSLRLSKLLVLRAAYPAGDGSGATPRSVPPNSRRVR
jgi:hypothetical protein